MKLALFPARGESLESLEKAGQLSRFVNYYLKKYVSAFDEVYVFSYKNEDAALPQRCTLMPNRQNFGAGAYSLLLPIIHRDEIKSCNAVRVFQISGVVPAIISKLFFGKNYVVTYGYEWSRFVKFNRGLFFYIIAKLIEILGLKMADKIIVTIEDSREYVRRYAAENKIVKIPNGVDVEQFKPMKVERSSQKRIIFVGRLEKQKNLSSLIRAVSTLGVGAELVLIGDGPLKTELKKLAEELGVNLILKGVVPHEKLPHELNKADVFVLPSFFEGHPKALLEAMSCGLPCVAANVQGIKEVIKDGENGLLCGTEASSIAEKVKAVLTNPELAGKLSSAARKSAVENYDIENLINKEIELLRFLSR